jgi:uridylate kinase
MKTSRCEDLHASRSASESAVTADRDASERPDTPKYRKIVLKISGEGFSSPGGFGIDIDKVKYIAGEIVSVAQEDVQIVVVVGGGNFIRGATMSGEGVPRTTADYMGMLATVLNALPLQEVLEDMGVPTRVQTAINMREVAEPYIRRRCIRHLEKGRVVILAAGTGNPSFTTDTAAALRATEIGAEVILKATKVDGVYSDDPMTNPDAKRFDTVTYLDVLNNKLRVMDSTAISMCMDNGLEIVVFNLNDKGAIRKAVYGETVGTLVRE